MTDYTKEILTTLGLIVAFIGLIPYIVDIMHRRTKPYCFSWFIWSFLTGTAFFGQIADQGGAGAWVTAINSAMCFLIFFLSLKYGERIIKKSDWITFIAALCAIPLWLATHTPLYSMILVTAIDMLGFYPTFRKSWNKPHEETITAFALGSLMYAFGAAALDRYTIITALYPISLVVTNAGFVLYVLWRRNVMLSQVRKL
ncbi:MAG: rane protein [Alphaproteobacteria bacterium]|nr:rane protein [Alphaproteobacteria bacterium]